MVINNEIYKRETKSWIAIQKATFNKTKTFFVSKFVLNLRKKLTNRYICSIAFYGAVLGHFGK